MNRSCAALPMAALLLLLPACSQNEQPVAEVKESPAETVTETTAITTPALPDLPAPRTLDIQDAHPNGTSVRLSSASFHEDHVQVVATVTNGGDRTTSLAQWDAALVDDRNVTYRLSPPPANPRLEVPPATSQEYRLVFLGRLSPEATTLSLIFNRNAEGNGNEVSRAPFMRLGPIPVNR